MTTEHDRSSLDDEEPGSQGEIDAGSEGDFGDPASSPSGAAEGDASEDASEDASGAATDEERVPPS